MCPSRATFSHLISQLNFAVILVDPDIYSSQLNPLLRHLSAREGKKGGVKSLEIDAESTGSRL
jgi:hypothetical protein